MSAELDAVLAKADQRLAIQNWFTSQGATPEQATVAANSQFEKFTFNGTLLFDGEPVNASDKALAHFRKHTPFLLGPETPELDREAVDPLLLDKAFVRHSPDARAEVLKRVGRDSVKLDKLAQDFGLRDARDYRTRGVRPGADDAEGGEQERKTPNPFAKETRNYTEMGRLVRQSPQLAASLAASAGVDISGRPLR